jgi:hypothetical protein
VIATPEGKPVETEFSSYWSPKREWVPDLIARSAAAEAFMVSGKKQLFVGVSAELIA